MIEISQTPLRLDIREFDDPQSESGRAWVIDVLDLSGNVIIEGAGVASGVTFAIAEAGQQIAYYLAEQWEMKGERL